MFELDETLDKTTDSVRFMIGDSTNEDSDSDESKSLGNLIIDESHDSMNYAFHAEEENKVPDSEYGNYFRIVPVPMVVNDEELARRELQQRLNEFRARHIAYQRIPLTEREETQDYWRNANGFVENRNEVYVITERDHSISFDQICSVPPREIIKQSLRPNSLIASEREQALTAEQWYELHGDYGCTYFTCPFVWYNYHTSHSNIITPDMRIAENIEDSDPRWYNVRTLNIKTETKSVYRIRAEMFAFLRKQGKDLGYWREVLTMEEMEAAVIPTVLEIKLKLCNAAILQYAWTKANFYDKVKQWYFKRKVVNGRYEYKVCDEKGKTVPYKDVLDLKLSVYGKGAGHLMKGFPKLSESEETREYNPLFGKFDIKECELGRVSDLSKEEQSSSKRTVKHGTCFMHFGIENEENEEDSETEQSENNNNPKEDQETNVYVDSVMKMSTSQKKSKVTAKVDKVNEEETSRINFNSSKQSDKDQEMNDEFEETSVEIPREWDHVQQCLQSIVDINETNRVAPPYLKTIKEHGLPELMSSQAEAMSINFDHVFKNTTRITPANSQSIGIWTETVVKELKSFTEGINRQVRGLGRTCAQNTASVIGVENWIKNTEKCRSKVTTSVNDQVKVVKQLKDDLEDEFKYQTNRKRKRLSDQESLVTRSNDKSLSVNEISNRSDDSTPKKISNSANPAVKVKTSKGLSDQEVLTNDEFMEQLLMKTARIVKNPPGTLKKDNAEPTLNQMFGYEACSEAGTSNSTRVVKSTKR